MSEEPRRNAESDVLTRLGRGTVGLGLVVLLLSCVPAVLAGAGDPGIAAVLLTFTAMLGLSLLVVGVGLQRGARWAAVALCATAPVLIALAIGLFVCLALSLPRHDLNGPEEPLVVSQTLAATIVVCGIPLWWLISYAWDARRTLQRCLHPAADVDLIVPAPAPRVSRAAVFAFALSLLIFLACWKPYRLDAAVVALLVTLAARVRIRRSAGRLRGTGFVWAAASIYVLTVVVQPAVVRERESAHKLTCVWHSKQLAVAMGSYLRDHNGVYPPADSWSDALKPYVSADTFRCPHSKNKRCGFAFNAALGSRRAADISADPARLVLFVESDAGWNAHGGPELLPGEPRHFGGDNVSFVDGHAKWVGRLRQGDSSPPRWQRAYPPEAVVWDPDAPTAEGDSAQRH
jgi:prepilin-type processing-associated H-X9-DG protein